MSSDQAWPSMTLKEAGVVLIDCDHRTPVAQDSGLPYIAIPQLKDGHVRLDGGERRISSEDFVEWTKKLKPREHDVIVVRRCNSGDSAVVPKGVEWAIGQNLVVLRSDGKSVYPPFLRWLVRSDEWWGQVNKYINVGAVFDSLKCREIPLFELPIPPIPHQVEIAQALNGLDDRITLLHETNATLEAIAQALFKSWFVDFDPVRAKQAGRAPEGMDEATAALFPDGFEESELGVVPRGWRSGVLADIADFQNGYAFKSKDWVEVGHPVVKIGDVKPGVIDFSGCSYVSSETVNGLERFRLNRGDLLVGMTGYVGETGLVPRVEPSAYLNQRVGRISARSGMLDIGFVYCIVRAPEFKLFAESQSHGSAQANVSGAALQSFQTVLPTIQLLDVFNSTLYPMLETILSNHERALAIATIRDTLLPRLISGQLRLPEATSLVEEVAA
ncbi:restriction endonuclease subunit S [Chitinimonas viridis]|uniref:Restriction endonuclease subunit S n=1 Tax=Chitinimonas viridis TaxID=664880 RepID=A0ABT8B1C0_9NEIS|nr:restriction endonuclease subunit S [Chitinimonas viridis]MDN3575916.1 restriction endonuclease subunit S [Chitinimonas viridis]